MNAEELNSLYYTLVRWLSKGFSERFRNMEELKEFLNKLESWLGDITFISKHAYLVDIFEQINCLNLKLQR